MRFQPARWASAQLVAFLFVTGAAAQAPPSPAEILGYPQGERFTPHAEIVRYFEHLSAASPLVDLRKYGETHEGRPLLHAVIAQPAHLSRLDEILAANRELSQPSTTVERARAIAATNPAVVYLTYGVHGNESSSPEAAMWTAWDLARGAPEAAGVLESVIVVIDPAANPDGRDRYVNWYRQAVGAMPNVNPESREHWEPWPGGRFNHYLFDLNRDWSWGTQLETRARLATWDYWTPVVHVDFHEMSYTSSYFFFPAAKPVNPLYPDHIFRWGEYFGDANAAAFDAHGWSYYTAESFDLFYPGYGDSWPSLVGAIGMTYEQAGHSRAGLAVLRPDGDTLTLHDRAQHHRTSGLATLRAAAARKTALLTDYARFHRENADLADVLLVPSGDESRLEALVRGLQAQDIEVRRAAESFRTRADAHPGFKKRSEFPAGTYLVRGNQPRGRLALTLLAPEIMLDATYSYDVTAWSLPYAYGVEAHSARDVPSASWRPVARDRPDAAVAVAVSPRAYGALVAPGLDSWKGIIRFLRAGGRVQVQDEAFRAGGRDWPAGTFFLPRRANDSGMAGGDGLARRLNESGLGQMAHIVETGLTESGPDLGTEEAYTLEFPRVAVLTGEGVSATSYGAMWFFFDQTIQAPFDALPVDRIEAVELDQYDVVVAPELGRGALPQARLDALKQWTERGGTLVAVGGAARVVAPIAEIKLREPEKDDDGDARIAAALRSRRERELDRWEQEVPGTVLPLTLDDSHPLAFGAGIPGSVDRTFVLHSGGDVFEPDQAFESAAYFAAGLNRTSGIISEENLKSLAQSSWLVTRSLERGRVILFADDPLFRHFWYATFQPFVNAIMLGPAL